MNIYIDESKNNIGLMLIGSAVLFIGFIMLVGSL
jgi:hypothetical protein